MEMAEEQIQEEDGAEDLETVEVKVVKGKGRQEEGETVVGMKNNQLVNQLINKKEYALSEQSLAMEGPLRQVQSSRKKLTG